MDVNLSPRFGRALAYAEEAHRDQRRKGSGVPYISHLLAVCALVLEHGGNEDEAIAALLHDAIEDQGGDWREADIQANFGKRVAKIVRACSSELKDGAEWRVRKQRYLDHLTDSDRSALLVSLADKVHNSRSILSDLRRFGAGVWDRFGAGPEEQRWYYRSLLAAYRQQVGDDAALLPLVEELARTLDDIWPDQAET